MKVALNKCQSCGMVWGKPENEFHNFKCPNNTKSKEEWDEEQNKRLLKLWNILKTGVELDEKVKKLKNNELLKEINEKIAWNYDIYTYEGCLIDEFILRFKKLQQLIGN